MAENESKKKKTEDGLKERAKSVKDQVTGRVKEAARSADRRREAQKGEGQAQKKVGEAEEKLQEAKESS